MSSTLRSDSHGVHSVQSNCMFWSLLWCASWTKHAASSIFLVLIIVGHVTAYSFFLFEFTLWEPLPGVLFFFAPSTFFPPFYLCVLYVARKSSVFPPLFFLFCFFSFFNQHKAGRQMTNDQWPMTNGETADRRGRLLFISNDSYCSPVRPYHVAFSLCFCVLSMSTSGLSSWLPLFP